MSSDPVANLLTRLLDAQLAQLFTRAIPEDVEEILQTLAPSAKPTDPTPKSPTCGELIMTNSP